MSSVVSGAEAVLEEGALCYVAAPDAPGPHLTPVVFVHDRGRIWLTTSRGSRKARLWRRDPAASGLVRAGPLAVTFRGRVTVYDALDLEGWPRSLARAPALARAWTMFTFKNLRFFAGYARDARRIPLGWSPPGRIFLSVDLEETAVVDSTSGSIRAASGGVGRRATSRSAYRALRARSLPDEGAPAEVRRTVGDRGRGALAVAGARGITVLPVRWMRDGHEGAYYAWLPVALLALGGARPAFEASLMVDQGSAWRATKMMGLTLRGGAEVFVPSRLSSGRASLERRVRSLVADGVEGALVRLRPDQTIWWKGWGSGTVVRP